MRQKPGNAVERTTFMISARSVVRFSMLAAGIGLAVGSSSGIAAADGLDFQISIDGYDLLPTVGNSATATSGMGEMAVAFGNGASAQTLSGLGNFAFADGTNAAALAGGGNYDTAIDIGDNTGSIPTGDDSTVGEFALAGAGDHDLALIIGDNNEATAGGDILETGENGNYDTAFIVNPSGAGDDIVSAGITNTSGGDYDLGGVLFDDHITNIGASGADYLYDIVTPFTTEMNAMAAMSAEWWAQLMALF
jgi:hypothetical protein